MTMHTNAFGGRMSILTSEEIDTLLAMAGCIYYYSNAFSEGVIRRDDPTSDRVDYKGPDTEETKYETFKLWRDR